MLWASFEDVIVDVGARCVARRGAPLRLEPKAFDLLLFLMKHSERCVLKGEIHKELWPTTHVSPASVPQLVKGLRRQLGDDAEAPRVIRTLHGRGYQFVAPLMKTGQRGGATARCAELDDTIAHLGSHVQSHLPLLMRAASSGIATFIEGQTGCGKQTLARALHRWTGGALSFISCPGLNAAELARVYVADPSVSSRVSGGQFVVLSGVTELAPDAQRWLLRRLESQACDEPSPAPRYLISTSRLSFRELAHEGGFRADLYARLAGVTLRIPALRERPREVCTAVDYFVRKYGDGRVIALTPRALAVLAGYDWPLNLTQLEATVRAVLWLQPAGKSEVTDVDLYRYLELASEAHRDVAPAYFAGNAE